MLLLHCAFHKREKSDKDKNDDFSEDFSSVCQLFLKNAGTLGNQMSSTSN